MIFCLSVVFVYVAIYFRMQKPKNQKMKTFFVVLFAVVATTYAASVVQSGKSSDLANIDPASETGSEIPVQIVYDEQHQKGEESSTSLRRNKRFLLTKLLLAKAALGAG